MSLIYINYLGFFDWVWSTSAKVSLLIIFLLLLKLIFKNQIGARLHYMLWTVVIVSLLVPWAPQSSFSVYNLKNLDIQKMASFNGEAATPTRSSTVDVGHINQESVNSLNQIAVTPNPSVLHNMGKPLNTPA